MSRVIRLRAFCRVQKQMFYPKYLQHFIIFKDGSWILYSDISSSDEYDSEKVITASGIKPEEKEMYDGVLMQYTGIKDTKGAKIFEGDILEIRLKDSANSVKSDLEVRVEGCDFVLYSLALNKVWGRLSKVCDETFECRVVGNIYENEMAL